MGWDPHSCCINAGAAKAGAVQLSQVGTSLWSLDTSQLNSIRFDPKELCPTNSIQAFDIIIQLIGTSKLVFIPDRVLRLQCLICLHLYLHVHLVLPSGLPLKPLSLFGQAKFHFHGSGFRTALGHFTVLHSLITEPEEVRIFYRTTVIHKALWVSLNMT